MASVKKFQKNVKVHSQGHMFKFMILLEGFAIWNTRAKYERSISSAKKVLANDEKFQKYVKSHVQDQMFKMYGTAGKVLS